MDQDSEAGQASRRKFLTASTWVLSSGIVAGLGAPAGYYLLTPILRSSEPTWVDLGDAAAFRASPTPLEVRFSYVGMAGYVRGRRPGLLLVVPEPSAPDGILVLSPICTHMGCNVSWAPEESLFACPCHGGRYDLQGEVVSGPPQRALLRVPSRVEEGQLHAEVEGA